MAQPWNTGPTHWFVRFQSGGGNSAPLYIGTLEGPPDQYGEDFAYDVIMNDLMGNKKPFARLYEGADCMVGTTFTNWRESTISLIESVPHLTTLSRGFNEPGDMGTIMELEQRTELWALFSYGFGNPLAKNVFNNANGRMAGGRHYFNAQIESVRRSPVGTGANKVSIVWYCGRIYDGSGVLSVVDANGNQLAANRGRIICYDHDMSAVNGLPLV